MGPALKETSTFSQESNRMRFNRLAVYSRIVVIAAIWLSTRTDVLAQSSTDLMVHYIEPAPVDDGISYNIDIYLSAVASGIPINNLEQDNFAVQEDGQKVEIKGLRPLIEEPLNVVLVLDTSASMSETDINNAKTSFTTFISRLKPTDRIAFITFDSSAKNQVDGLTNEHQKIIDIIDNKTFPTREAGTCLYDAAYSALKMFTPQHPGSRAVILLTNGKDETSTGAKCSDRTSDEVISVASEGDLRAPLYVIGLEVDEKSEDGRKNYEILQNFANMSGGSYVNLSSSSKLANTLDTLSTQFLGQFILTYASIAMPGAHNISISLIDPNQPDPLDSESRKINLEPLPPHIAFTTPQDGENIVDTLKIAISLTTQGDAVVERVAFEVNGSKEGEDDTKPYEIELDATGFPSGLMTITATAYGENNTELARNSINIIRTEATAATVVIPTQEIAPAPEVPTTTDEPANSNPMIPIAIALSTLSIVGIGALILLLLRQQKQAVIRDLENFVGDDDSLAAMQGISVYRKVEGNQEAVHSDVGPDVLGTITVEASDDTTLIGHRIEITTPLVTLGRSADNDIIFPNDKPVSRHHAEIYQISGKLYLREVNTADASGVAKPPKYGTFLNQMPMGSDAAQLKTGDEIQLGKRVILKFESHKGDVGGDALTYDEDDDDDRTATNSLDVIQE